MKLLFPKCLTFSPKKRLRYNKIKLLIPDLKDDKIKSYNFPKKLLNILQHKNFKK